MSFAEKLQEIRQNNELSQEALAELLNVSRQSVSKWERGRGYPEIDKLIFISEHFNVSLDELLKGKKQESSRSYRERKPINLTKPEDSTSENIQEIYPQNNTFFNNAVVSEPGDLARYENYQTQPQSVRYSQPEMKNGARKRFHRRKLRRFRSLSLFRKFAVISTGLVSGLILALIITAIAEANMNRYSISTEPSIDSVSYYTEGMARYMIDESTGTRYVFETDSPRGIVTSLTDVDLSRCTKLTDPLTGETRYCEEYYFDESAVIIPDSCSYAYVIPEFMLSTSVPDEYQNEFQVGQDSNSSRWFYVPNTLIEQCEEAVSAFYADRRDDETEESEVYEEADEPADVEVPEDNDLPEDVYHDDLTARDQPGF